MNRPELIQECSRRFGKRAWLGATSGELEACLADGVVPLVWASGRRTSPDAAMAGSVPTAPQPEASNLLSSPESPRESPGNGGDTLADAIASALQGRISAGVDEAQVR